MNKHKVIQEILDVYFGNIKVPFRFSKLTEERPYVPAGNLSAFKLPDFEKRKRLPIYIGFSGGKDSTVTLSLVSQALKSIHPDYRDMPIYVLFSDTLMEMPPVVGQIHNSIERFIEFAEENDLPFIFQTVSPELKNRFFNLIIGKGATLPRKDMRWCTTKMKIMPMEKAVDAVLGAHGGYIAFTGARKDESPDRAARLERNAVSPGSKLKVHADSRCNLFCPIEDWSSDDVWNHIYTEADDWVDANGLGVVYSEAAGDGDECTTVLEGGEAGQKPGCSKSARYGCWVCPLFDRDKTLNNLSRGHDYLVFMEQFRNWLIQYRDGEWHNCRDVYNHRDGFKRLQYNYDNNRYGMTSPGGYNLEFRKEILFNLLETEKMVNTITPLRLIEDEDLEFIQHCWIQEGDANFSCVKIAEEFGRSVHVSDKDALIAESAQLLDVIKRSTGWSDQLVARFGIYANERFCTQFIIEKFELGKKSRKPFDMEKMTKEISKFIFEMMKSDSPALTMAEALHGMKLSTQFYPTPDLEKMIRREWETDETSYATKMLMGIEWDKTPNCISSVSGEEFYDFTEDPNISLEDKMSMLDNWKYYEAPPEIVDDPSQLDWEGKFNSIQTSGKSQTAKGKKKAKSEEEAEGETLLQSNSVAQMVVQQAVESGVTLVEPQLIVVKGQMMMVF